MVRFKRKRVSFKATKIIKVPKKVSFRTKDGRKVSFNATRLVRKPKRVSFLARKKRR